ncbi:MAG TPA: DNA polymerase III subunit gamma/tau [Candidatus Saccharimonadia bacterium]|nr:DNA polymerase III subunit gamma/tau [Candidatus Saccharimonadia bacterium]
MPTTPPSTPSSTSGHMALYRRWRAQRFDQIVGQGTVVETLRNAVRLDRLAHGFLFVGPRGTGKTSMARILAKAVNCPNIVDGEPCDACPSCEAIREGRALDVVEMDAASNNKVDDMRELVPRVYTAPSDLRRKVFIIDEVQRIKEGWDVLLKTLEEPPDDVLFIFCTTNPAQIRPAVVSRLQRFTFRPLTVEQIDGKLRRILAEDGQTADDEAVELVAHLAAGGMRDAESMLDQLLSAGIAPITADAVRDLLGMADEQEIDAFLAAVVGGRALDGIAVLDRLEAAGRDLPAFADQLVARLREVVVGRLGGSADGPVASPIELAEMARRIAALDANRSMAGGFRFQLELLLFQGAAQSPHPALAASASQATGAETTRLRPTAASERRPASGPASTLTADAAKTVPAALGKPTSDTMLASIAAADSTPVSAPTPAHSGGPKPNGDEALRQLRGGWRLLVAHVSQNPANRPLIEAARPVEVSDGVVVLGFPEDQAFLRDIAERKKRMLEEAVREVMGADYAVRCVATNVAAPGDDDGAAVDAFEIARRIFEGEIIDAKDVADVS